MPAHSIHEKLPPGVENVETVLIYRRVHGHPEPDPRREADVLRRQDSSKPLSAQNAPTADAGDTVPSPWSLAMAHERY